MNKAVEPAAKKLREMYENLIDLIIVHDLC